MKITDQIVPPRRGDAIVDANGVPTLEYSEFMEHVALKLNMLWVVIGTPESQITAAVGSIALRLDGGASTSFYVKESGTGDTGWIAK